MWRGKLVAKIMDALVVVVVKRSSGTTHPPIPPTTSRYQCVEHRSIGTNLNLGLGTKMGIGIDDRCVKEFDTG